MLPVLAKCYGDTKVGNNNCVYGLTSLNQFLLFCTMSAVGKSMCDL